MTNATTKNPSPCCLSHLFHNAALQSPNKVAVVHSRGGATVARQFHDIYLNNIKNQFGSSYNSLDEYDKVTASKATTSPSSSRAYNHHCYEGDKCFTYSEILSAVECLSVRLRRILDGADDPHLVKPSSGITTSDQSVAVEIPGSSDSSGLTLQISPNVHDSLIPRAVGIYIEPSVEYIVAVLSVLRCGGSFIPLDPYWPSERILSIVDSSKADLVIGHNRSIEGDCFHKLDELSWLVNEGCCPVLRISMEDYAQDRCESSQLLWPCECERQRSFCYLMYTSGSTGRPKGVCGTEKGLLNRFLWMQEQYPLHGNEVLLFKTPISFIDHLQEILGALFTTCMLVIPPFSLLKENLFFVVDFLQMYEINRFIAVPSLLRTVLPVMRSPQYTKIQRSLKLLVLSGETFPLQLWRMLVDLLPNATILNLYGSTEVAGDCTYFDCKRLQLILENEALESVPIGLPISNCCIRLGEEEHSEGEIYVGGQCIAAGYFSYPSVVPLDCVELQEQSPFCCPTSEHRFNCYFKSGDFARRLQCGDLVFHGRKDRLIKVNGQRVALEEIENTLRGHPGISDAAVVFSKGPEKRRVLKAHVIKKPDSVGDDNLMSSIRTWMLSKLTVAMVPVHIFFEESFPTSSSGKVDYTLLASSTCGKDNGVEELITKDLIRAIQKVFCDTLMVEKVSIHDDFFEMGGNSVSAAYASYKLGINMKLLYTFPTPLKLQMALGGKMASDSHPATYLATREPDENLLHSVDSSNSGPHANKRHAQSLRVLRVDDVDYPSKFLKINKDTSIDSKESSRVTEEKEANPREKYVINPDLVQFPCALSRCNRVMYEGECEVKRLCQTVSLKGCVRDTRGSMQEVWKVCMESCVDASPLIVLRGTDLYLFIGSHSYRFVSIDAKSGSVLWEIKLQGRIECSAAILDDFSQVVVGCYQGNIYFLNFSDGGICWTFQTGGEVKSQPVVDKSRHLVWCGSYDHNLYALDYKNYSCFYKVHCGGSIFGSPAIDEVRERLFVASTSGQMTAVSLTGLPFSISWAQDLNSPVFGSLMINYCNGNIICCLVDGSVLALDTSGSTIWKARTGGPIFAGPCLSSTLPSQVLICSRDGSIYSFGLEKGDRLWEYALGQPISSSAYVDEHLQLASDASPLTDRLICICTSSGSIHVLRINMDASGESSNCAKDVQEFAKFDLSGDIFSSPVMIGGRIFVGCRDDYVHCIKLDD